MQRLVSFKCDEANFLTTNKGNYFMLVEDDCYYMVNADCPHRRGPLHLGKISSDGKKIVCPMHGMALDKDKLCQRALPCVYRNGLILVLLQLGETLVAVRKVLILAIEETYYDEMCVTQ